MSQQLAKIDTNRENTHEYVMGGTGSGKSYYIKSQLKKARRVLVFDPDDEYGEIAGMQTAYTASELLRLVTLAGSSKALKVRFVANGVKAFDFVCATSFVWANHVLVVEELADVTTPSKASDNWGKVLRRGRKRGIKIMAASQRPAEADKTIFTQVNKLRCGRLDGEGDIRRVANNMQCDANLIMNLRPLDFIEFDRKTGALIAGHKQRHKTIRAKYGDLITL